MANYPVKMLKDESGAPFVPLVAPGAVRDGQGFNLLDELDNKLEKTNIIAGQNVTITTSGNDITINSAAGGAGANVIDNLDQTTGGVGVLDAHQGHVLKEMIPDVVNNLTTVDGTKALSAYQGYLLNHKIVPTGGTTGQVLKKKSATDNDLEWGDAADPNAISGDSSVKKIVALTYEEYQQLVTDGEVEQDTEYHITDAPDTINELQQEVNELRNNLIKQSSVGMLRRTSNYTYTDTSDWTAHDIEFEDDYNWNGNGYLLNPGDGATIQIGEGVSLVEVTGWVTVLGGTNKGAIEVGIKINGTITGLIGFNSAVYMANTTTYYIPSFIVAVNENDRIGMFFTNSSQGTTELYSDVNRPGVALKVKVIK